MEKAFAFGKRLMREMETAQPGIRMMLTGMPRVVIFDWEQLSAAAQGDIINRLRLLGIEDE